MKISENFKLEEFINPDSFYDLPGDKSLLLIDKRLVDIMEYIRYCFGRKIIINTWHNFGLHKNRGFRKEDCKEGAKYSQHKFGRAVDFEVEGFTSEEVFEEILLLYKTEKDLKKYGLTRIEKNTKGYTHIDLANTQEKELTIFEK